MKLETAHLEMIGKDQPIEIVAAVEIEVTNGVVTKKNPVQEDIAVAVAVKKTMTIEVAKVIDRLILNVARVLLVMMIMADENESIRNTQAYHRHLLQDAHMTISPKEQIMHSHRHHLSLKIIIVNK